jgi:hypothetical protein
VVLALEERVWSTDRCFSNATLLVIVRVDDLRSARLPPFFLSPLSFRTESDTNCSFSSLRYFYRCADIHTHSSRFHLLPCSTRWSVVVAVVVICFPLHYIHLVFLGSAQLQSSADPDERDK